MDSNSQPIDHGQIARTFPEPLKWALQVLGLAAAYYICGWLALRLAIPPGYATAVWPAAAFTVAVVFTDIIKL